MKKWKNSLFRQMLALAGIILLILMITYILIIHYVTELNKRSVLQLNDRIIEQIQGESEKFRDSMNHIATTLVYSPTTYEYFMMDSADRAINNENMSTVYLNTTLLEDDIAGVYLYDSEMHMICGMGEELRETDHMEFIHVKKEKMEFSNIFITEQSGMSYYVMYFPVYDLSNTVYGKQIGMSAFILRTTTLEDMIKDDMITEHAEMYLLDGNGQIVSARGSMQSGILEKSKMESDSAFYVRTKELGLDGWKVVSRIPRNEMTGSLKTVYWGITLAYVCAFVLIGCLLYFCYRQLVMPIYQMNYFIQNIVANPENRMVSKRKDEIGTVIESLNRMLDEKKILDAEVKKSQQQMYEAELAKKQLQVLAYHNQINPHFLYNTFDCIRAMALYHDVDEIAEITLALSHVFRYSIKGENIVRIEEEVNYIREYARIIEYRFAGKIDVAVHVEDAVKKKNMIKLILQPLVENAVFHGLEKKIEGGKVNVDIRMADERHVRFTIEDNGCGMEEKTLAQVLESLESRESTEGIGMTNIYQRLKLFYGDETEFLVESSYGKGTKVMIIIPDEVRDGGAERV